MFTFESGNRGGSPLGSPERVRITVLVELSQLAEAYAIAPFSRAQLRCTRPVQITGKVHELNCACGLTLVLHCYANVFKF